MGLSVETLAVAKTYTDSSISGISGTLAGKNCTIQSITDIEGGHRVTFQWTADDSTVRTSTMDVMDGSGADAIEQIYADNGVTGAKNLLHPLANYATESNITFTLNSDYSVTLANTSSARVQRNFANQDTPYNFAELVGKEVVLSGCPSGGSTSTYRINAWFYDGNNQLNYNDIGSGVSFTFPDIVNSYTTWNIKIDVVNANVDMSGKTFYPMLRLASDTDDTYQPYAMTNRNLTEKVVPTTDVKNTVISTYCDTTNSIIDIVRVGKIVQITAKVVVTTAIPAYTKFMEGLPTALFPSNGGDARVLNFLLYASGSTHYRCYMDGTGNINNHATQIPVGSYFLSFMCVAQ